jgi:dTDP-4-dehydrorhamnose reductase
MNGNNDWMVKVLITGSNGQLGRSIKAMEKHYPYHFIFTDIDELDITDMTALHAFFAKHSIDFLINCAAFTNVDQAQTQREAALLINATAVGNLAKMATLHDFHIIHISTDYVFNGKNYRPWTEDYKPDPVNVYGRSKLAGEEALAKFTSKATVIRTSWLYSEYGNNFLNTMLRLGKTGAKINVVYDQIGTPTYAHDLGQMILDIIPRLAGQNEIGLYHYSNEGVTTWYDFAKAIFEIQKIDAVVYPIESKEYRTPAARPYFSVLNAEKIKNTFGISIPYWRDSLKLCLSLLSR